eukprot:4532382-Amphidinium_carterae.1
MLHGVLPVYSGAGGSILSNASKQILFRLHVWNEAVVDLLANIDHCLAWCVTRVTMTDMWAEEL